MVNDAVPAGELTQLEELAEALSGYSHPTEFAIARVLSNQTDSSSKLIADELELPMGQVAYHVRKLAPVGILEQTRMEPARGAVQRFYRLTDLGREWLRRHG